jgi:hypothetical protein
VLKLTSIDAPRDIKDARFSGFGSPRRRNIKNPGPGASECPFGTNKCSRKRDPGQGDYLGASEAGGGPSFRVLCERAGPSNPKRGRGYLRRGYGPGASLTKQTGDIPDTRNLFSGCHPVSNDACPVKRFCGDTSARTREAAPFRSSRTLLMSRPSSSLYSISQRDPRSHHPSLRDLHPRLLTSNSPTLQGGRLPTQTLGFYSPATE